MQMITIACSCFSMSSSMMCLGSSYFRGVEWNSIMSNYWNMVKISIVSVSVSKWSSDNSMSCVGERSSMISIASSDFSVSSSMMYLGSYNFWSL